MPFDDNTFLTYRQPQDPVLQLLVDGLAYIRKEGWIQHEFWEPLEWVYDEEGDQIPKDPTVGPVCALGAIGHREDKDPTADMSKASKFLEDFINQEGEKRTEEYRQDLQAEYGDDWGDYADENCDWFDKSVDDWNDDSGREQSEIEALFERAIELRSQQLNNPLA